MTLLDVNVLLYAKMDAFEHHPAMRVWLSKHLSGTARVGIPWAVLLAFARLASSPRVFERPMTVAATLGQVAEWLALPLVWTPSPSRDHAEILARLAGTAGVTSAGLPDTHLAALAVEHGLMVVSADRGFARYRGVAWRNPLEAQDPND